MSLMSVERRFERILEITRDILRLRELDLALESIARGVVDLFGFRYVTIVLEDDQQSGEMIHRPQLGNGQDSEVAKESSQFFAIAVVGVGHAQQRFREHHQCEALFGR